MSTAAPRGADLELAARPAATPYEAYVYPNPHKTAYRRLEPRVRIADAWRDERKDALFLYLHVPFCEMRCGFCNLFTTARPRSEAVDAYLAALARQCAVVRAELGEPRFARVAIGGGTPTLLETRELATLLDLAERAMGADLARVPVSVETSPETIDAEKAALLRARGVDRVSIGVQSFADAEAAAVNRPQSRARVEAALEVLRGAGFPVLNVDLMYGLPGQTAASWIASLQAALRFRPEELYLYPLYVRPLTTLGRRGTRPRPREDDPRVALYRLARELLLAAGFTQSSMRMFRAKHAPGEDGPVYCVQDDGMVGVGCGARSYTRALHYASEYAVGARGVREILDAWVRRSDADFAFADHGFRLDLDEQHRRYVCTSLFGDGVDLGGYRRRFGSEALDDLPELARLAPLGLAAREGRRLSLTERGVELSDAIGPWLFSERVRSLMAASSLR